MNEREALKLALEFVDNLHNPDWGNKERQKVITAIKEVLAQPEQEPVIGTKTWFEDGKVVTQHLTAKDIYKDPPQTNAYDNMLKAIDSMRPAARMIKDKPATWWLDEFEKVVRNLKENNNG